MENTGNETKSKGFYGLAGITAFLFVAVILLDIVTSIMAGKAALPGTLSAADVFAQFQADPFRAFQYLGFLNIIEQMMMLVIVFGFYLSHKQAHKNSSTLALAIFIIGLAVYIANNVSMPLYYLSAKYASADAQLRPLLASAGEALLAKGEDFTPGSLPGFFIGEVSLFLMLITMLRAGIFSRVSSVIGIVGAVLLTVFTFGATLNPPMYNTLMTMSMFGGLLMLAWYVMVALRFFKLK
jgi:hypothetical protein